MLLGTVNVSWDSHSGPGAWSCSLCASLCHNGTSYRLNWPQVAPLVLVKHKFFSKWAGGKALGIFHSRDSSNPLVLGVTRIPSFQWLSQAMNWVSTWLGCGTGSHKAYGLLAMMHIPSQMGQDSEVPFCENRARGRAPRGAAPDHNSHGTHGQRGSWPSDTPPSHSDREPGWAWVGRVRCCCRKQSFLLRDTASKLQDSSALGTLASKASGLCSCPFFKYP